MPQLSVQDRICDFCLNDSHFVTNYHDRVKCELRSSISTDLHTGFVINRLNSGLHWGVDESDFSCQFGYDRIADQCHPWPLGGFRRARTDRYCSVCSVDKFADSTSTVECVACPAHSTTMSRNASTAVTSCICDAGYQWNTQTLSCDACPPGTFRTENDVLQETLEYVTCPADHYPTPDSTGCTPCPANERSDAGAPSIDHCNCARATATTLFFNF